MLPSAMSSAGLTVRLAVLTADESCNAKTITRPSVTLVINAPSR